VDDLDLGHYRLFHAIRANLLRRQGRVADARSAYDAAINCTDNTIERSFLQRQRDGLTGA
jgi:RNA polymerase sigma-70 factor (ECF subfamily)